MPQISKNLGHSCLRGKKNNLIALNVEIYDRRGEKKQLLAFSTFIKPKTKGHWLERNRNRKRR